MMLPAYPQPLLYDYRHSYSLTGSPSERAVAPIGLALNLEVINNRPTATKVRSYFAELETGVNEWTRLGRLPMAEPRGIYLAEGRPGRYVNLDFRPGYFDAVAREKTLPPGGSLAGWVFFEWPPELRGDRRLRNFRVRVENSQGETEEAVFNLPARGGGGQGAEPLDAGGFGAAGPGRTDLTGVPIRPFGG